MAPERIRYVTVILVGLLTALDLILAAGVRIYADEIPVVSGDVAKVGIGILSGVALMGGPSKPPPS